MHATKPKMAKKWEKEKESVKEEDNKAALMKLYTTAMKMMPSSPKQKAVIKKIAALRKKLGMNEAMSDAEIKKMHKKYKETGELPPHLKKMAKDLDKFKVKHKVKNIVVPGLEWMADIEEGTCGYSIDGEGDDEPAGPHLLKKIKKEDFDSVPAKWSSQEAKSHMDSDVKQMSKILGKASYHIIKIMMDGVKGKRYDALDIIRGIDTGALNRTHDGERPFMKMLWRKVRNEFRRYLPKDKLRR